MDAEPTGDAAHPAEVRLVDHHCHSVVRTGLDRASFEALLTEGPGGAAGLSVFDSMVGLSVRRWCAPLLDLPPHADPDDYLARRAELGMAEVTRRLLRSTGVAALLVDGGFRADELIDHTELAAAAAAPVLSVLRLESVAEALADGGIGPSDYPAAVETAVRSGAAGAVAVKSIAAYRSGLDLDPTAPTPAEVSRAAAGWLPRRISHRAPLVDPVLVRHLLWMGILTRRPLQIHTGFGDSDEDLLCANPALLTGFCRATAPLAVPVMLLHCYPYHREAAWLAHVFPHVYVDVGLASTYAGMQAAALLTETAEIAPFGKILYSSDGFGLPELHLLGALRFRAACRQFVGALLTAGEATSADAARITYLIAAGNARRVYGLDRLG